MTVSASSLNPFCQLTLRVIRRGCSLFWPGQRRNRHQPLCDCSLLLLSSRGSGRHRWRHQPGVRARRCSHRLDHCALLQPRASLSLLLLLLTLTRVVQGAGCYTSLNGIFFHSASDCNGAEPGQSVSEIATYGIPLNKIVIGKYLESDASSG